MPTKLCIRCHGTGHKFGGTCFRCKGTGTEPQYASAVTSKSAAEILFDVESDLDITQPRDPMPDHGTTKGGSDFAIDSEVKKAILTIIEKNRIHHDQQAVTIQTDVNNLRGNINSRFTTEQLAHAKAISALENKVEEQAKLIQQVRRVEINLRTADGLTTTLPQGHRHPMFETLLKIAASRQADGFHPNIWIAGPAGSGKTTGGRQLAKALGIPFFFNGAVNMEHKLIGFVDANGSYHSTPFREGFTQPAVYQFDDVDSSDNAALIPLNAATANGICDFADTIVERHPDSIIIATANTWGLGATSDYVGRVKLDAAFLSRFPCKLYWGYDEAFETAISGNPSWAKRVQRARAKCFELGIKVVIDPRITIAGAGLLASGNFSSEQQVAELTYLANLTPDQRAQVQ